MTENKLTICCGKLHPLQTAILTFNQNGIFGLSHLLSIVKEPSMAKIHPGDLITCMAVEISQDWRGDGNRTVRVTGLVHADPTHLAPMAKYVERIEVPDHGAKALFTIRANRLEEAAAPIIRSVLTDEFKASLGEWGLTLYADACIPTEESPGILFSIWNGIPGIDTAENAIVARVFLDGFSGRMSVDGVVGDELYTRPVQLQKLLRAAFNASLEKLTA